MRLQVPISACSLPLCLLCCYANPEKAPGKDQPMADSPSSVSVTSVSVSGSEHAYTLNVTIKSTDTGCEQYADWWEVLDLGGNLIYRRILAHSHVNEQPFTRSGGKVAISGDQQVYVRGHMNNSGYGSAVIKGSVSAGFLPDSLDTSFAGDLEQTEPLPEGCAF